MTRAHNALATPLVPVFAWKSANGYPKPQNNVAVDLMPLGQALARPYYTTDAHFAAYTTTEARRLNNAAVGQVPIAMVYLVADVDDPVAHRLGIDARDEWRAVEEEKIAKFRAKHPGVIIYGTNGGYRSISGCEPFPIATPEDAKAWWDVYLRFVKYLRDQFGIIADPACKDFGRLFRLPSVRRDGVQIEGPLAGDPHNIERFDMSRLPQSKTAHPFVRAAFKKAVKAVRTAKNGARNATLNREAFGLGGFVASGHLDEIEVTDALLDAIVDHNGGDITKDSTKIVSAINAGKQQPREPPQPTSLPGASRAKRGPAAGAAAPEMKRGTEQDPALEERLGDGRPEIRISSEVMEMTSQASAALQGDPTIYKRNDQLVHVTHTTREEVESSRVVDTDDGPRRELVEGTPRIRIVQFPTLKERLSAVAQFLKYDSRRKEKWVPARPDGDVVAALLARGEWKDVRHLRGIVETPTLRPDGSILQGEPRYDAATVGGDALPERRDLALDGRLLRLLLGRDARVNRDRLHRLAPCRRTTTMRSRSSMALRSTATTGRSITGLTTS